MKTEREWQDFPELFEVVADSLQNGELGDQVVARDEEGSYRERGTITIKLDGRKFQITLHEIS